MSYFEFPHTRTYDSDLGWLIKTVKSLCTLVEGLEDWKTEHETEYLQLKALYDAVMSGNFPQSITDAFYSWMQENALDLVGSMVKRIHFGLTNDGYFCAFIPAAWDDIHFDTVIDGDDPLYGHLMVIYD